MCPKSYKRGTEYVSYRARAILISDLSLLRGKLDIFQLLETYFEARERSYLAHTGLFLGVKVGRKGDPLIFFKPQAIGRNKISSIVKKVCRWLGIRGDGVAKHMKTHGLGACMISLLTSSGFSDAAVVLRTGHRDSRSLLNYRKLKGSGGLNQVAALFTSSDHEGNNQGEKSREKCDGREVSKQIPKKTRLMPELLKEDLDGVEIFGGQVSESNCRINVSIHHN